jgi:serine/threonine-protein kinase
MSLVYRAHDTLLNRVVAVKVLRAQYASDDDVVRRFRREAQASASLSHPNIVGIYDVGRQGDMYYIVMEYIAGYTLKQRIQKEGPLTVDKALDITAQICEALEHAHAHKVIHRDIKPHNIMLTPAGKVKVADFGIARAATSSTLTHSGTIMGSVHYFSPEQARGGLTSEKSDIYSLGVVMYEMLAGRVPFEGDSAITIALKHVQENVVPPRRIVPRIPEAVERIVMKALEKDQASRYQSASDMLADLDRVSGSGERAAGMVGPDNSRGGTRARPDGGQAQAPAEDRQVARHAKRSRRRPVILLVVLIIIAGLAAFGWVSVSKWLNVASIQVPNVVGRSLTEAQKTLGDAKLVPYVVAEKYDEKIAVSHIVAQQPEGGQIVKVGRTINLVVSMGQEFTVVPDVTGRSLREAGIVLNTAGLEVGTIRSRNHPTVLQDNVLTQNPRAGTRVAKGTLVDVEISMGPEAVTVVVPNFVGEQIDSVLQKLGGLKLVQGAIAQKDASASPGAVVEQDPPADSPVKEGTPINFVVSRGQGVPARRAQVSFKVPQSGKDMLAIRVTLTDSLGTRTIYQQRHPPGTELKLQVEWSGPEARVRFFVDDAPVREEALR